MVTSHDTPANTHPGMRSCPDRDAQVLKALKALKIQKSMDSRSAAVPGDPDQ